FCIHHTLAPVIYTLSLHDALPIWQEEDNLLSRFKFLRNSTILILALMLLIIPLLGYVMYMNLRVKNKNKELHDKNQLVEAQKEEDRKSTRLNSSHVSISYAVFCLK